MENLLIFSVYDSGYNYSAMLNGALLPEIEAKAINYMYETEYTEFPEWCMREFKCHLVVCDNGDISFYRNNKIGG